MSTDNPSVSDLITTSSAKKAGVIRPVLVTNQKGVKFFTFTLTAEQFMELGRVERFGETEFGVNRRYSDSHAIAIAEAMLESDVTFAENPIGALEGGWTFVNGELRYKRGAYIVLDDGQHRRGALEVLNPDERLRWEYIITVTQGVDYATRVKLFLQQDKSRRIDARLKLQMQHEVGDWKTEAERRAYGLCQELATDPRSPLKDMIIMGETDKRPYEGRHRPAGINVKGLHLTFTSLMSRRSPLSQLSEEKQLEVCKNMVRAAAHAWPNAWQSSRHTLTTARGINAVLKLMISGNAFKLAVGNDFSYDNLLRVFGTIPKFDWGAKRSKNETEAVLRERLDRAIGNALARSAVEDADAIMT